MNANVKKALNRGGLIAMIVGGVAIVIGGGDAGAAIDTVGTAVAIAGMALVFVRELLG